MASRRVLILFSGPYHRPDGLAAFLTRFGIDPVLVDNDPSNGGGTAHDLRRRSFFDDLLRRCHAGEFMAVFTAPPCSTFSVARLFSPTDGGESGPPPVRDRANIHGLPNVPPRHVQELRIANLLVRRTVALIYAASQAGAEFSIENPADRGDPDSPHFLDARHGPLWLLDEIRTLAKYTGASSYTFPMCAFGSKRQKYTTLLSSPRLASLLEPLTTLRCTHTHHQPVGSARDENGNWISASTAAYPPDFNLFVARCIASLVIPMNKLAPDTWGSDGRPGPTGMTVFRRGRNVVGCGYPVTSWEQTLARVYPALEDAGRE